MILKMMEQHQYWRFICFKRLLQEVEDVQDDVDVSIDE
jgi:hypothetical protein